MLLQYKTDDSSVLSLLCEFLVRCHTNVAFSWIPFMSCLCVFCPDVTTHDIILTDIRSELNVEPINRSEK